jgi:hypothetical protein
MAALKAGDEARPAGDSNHGAFGVKGAASLDGAGQERT